jgi:hypothetical protein
MCTESSYGPQMAVAFHHPRFLVETRTHCLAGTESCRNDKISCSEKEQVSKRRTVPLALSPSDQVTDLPETWLPTHSAGHNKCSHGPEMTGLSCPSRVPMNPGSYQPYGHATAISLIQQGSPQESSCLHIDGVELGLSNVGCCFVSENTIEQWTVPESMCCHLDNVVLCQSDKIHCSAIDNVSRPWTVPKALSPCIQVIISLFCKKKYQ